MVEASRPPGAVKPLGAESKESKVVQQKPLQLQQSNLMLKFPVCNDNLLSLLLSYSFFRNSTKGVTGSIDVFQEMESIMGAGDLLVNTRDEASGHRMQKVASAAIVHRWRMSSTGTPPTTMDMQ